jgi:wobble nucleotide-excising tRNase
MNLYIKNCNNIDDANVIITEGKLNIKFAPNGTGKSTIANAIRIQIEDSSALGSLMPFKLRETNPEDKKPTVTGADTLTSILCFNEEYVNQFVFQQEELLSNSFNILFLNEDYLEREREIEELMNEIKSLFTNNQALEQLIANLKELGSAFKLTKDGLSKASSGMKGLSQGNKIQHIPQGLESYQPFLQSQNSVGWIDWQTKGCEFLELDSSCPFCTSQAEDKREIIKKIGDEYDKNSIKNLINIIRVIDELGEFLSVTAKGKLSTITTLQDGLEKEHEDYIVAIKKQIDNLVAKLENLRALSGFAFKADEKVAEKLPTLKLDLEFFSELDSEATRTSITPINNSIDSLILKAGLLQGKLNIQRQRMQTIVEKNQTEINAFLAYAGYKYKVAIIGDGLNAKLRLLHVDHDECLNGGSQHLSFGERNAFALVLFMYECLSKNPNLIVLDDPISSFDKNKKYAILEMLFRRGSAECLKNKTVLMLTHDVEPIIDMVKALSTKFANQTNASYLKLAGGMISEFEIRKDDVQTFAEICCNALNGNKHEVIKLIYLRRDLEISDSKGDAYEVISNLLHKRVTLLDSREPRQAQDVLAEMQQAIIASGLQAILTRLPQFNYHIWLQDISDDTLIRSLYQQSQNGYEKLQLFRFLELDIGNSVIQKFINETYHIENEYICQLDPSKFDLIPEYVITECDRLLAETAPDA